MIRQELKKQPVLRQMKECQFWWFGHGELPFKTAWETKIPSKRSMERSGRTWQESVDTALERSGIAGNEAKTMPYGREGWKKLLYGNK